MVFNRLRHHLGLRGRPARLAAMGVTLLVLTVPRAAVAFPSSRLVYARGKGAERCSDEAELHRAVASRLGYDPFFPTADRTIMVIVAAETSRLKGTVYVVDAGGVVHGTREFFASLERCDRLLQAMALSISIAIDEAAADPGRAAVTSTSSDENPAPAPVPPADGRLAPPPPRDEPAPAPIAKDSSAMRTTTSWALGVGGMGTWGLSPSPAVGATAFGSLSYRRWSLVLEGWGHWPQSSEVEGRTVDVWQLGLKLGLCGQFSPWFSCLIADAGILSAAGQGPSAPPQDSAAQLAAGIRVGAELPLSGDLGVRLHGDLLATLLPVHIRSQDVEVWSTPFISASAGVAAVLHFR